jgi:hypothetical protein
MQRGDEPGVMVLLGFTLFDLKTIYFERNEYWCPKALSNLQPSSTPQFHPPEITGLVKPLLDIRSFLDLAK